MLRKDLHVKFYASGDFAMVTSMNLHEFSQNNNVEIAIKLLSKNALKKIADFALSDNYAGDTALKYFEEVIESSEHIFKKTPRFKSGLLGF
jgi:hypothetical protein